MTTTRGIAGGTVLGAILCISSPGLAATYYIDPAGSDSNNGTSEATPWATLTKLSSVKSGDTVNFKAGGSWNSSGLNVNGVTYQRYGSGDRPTIVGTGSGYAVISVQGNAVVDGLRVRGTGSATQGIGVMGSNNTVRNCEVDGSDKILQLGFGVMGTGNLITQNYVHDLSGMTGDSGDMNTSGGAEAYMIMASDNEISYNSAVRCWGPNTTLNGFEGGCLEIVNGKAGSTISNVRFHHNYCEDSVGLFEGCSGNFQGTDKIQENHGKIEDVEVSYNISVDSMWMYLLQPVNTDFKNVRFSNNTLIHTDKSWTLWSRNDSFAMTVASDAGYTVPADYAAGTISVRNNIFVDNVTGHSLWSFFGSNVADHSNNIFVPANAKLGSLAKGDTEQLVALADLAFTADYRIGAGSKAIDKAVAVGFAEDIDHHAVPCGAAPDVGASEFCEGAGGSTGSGGSTGTSSGNGGTTNNSGMGGVPSTATETGNGGSTNQTAATNTVAAGMPNGTSAAGQEGGCSCRTAGDARGRAVALLVLALCALGSIRPRRRRNG